MHFVCEGCGGRQAVGGGEEGSAKAFGKVKRRNYRKSLVVDVSKITIPTIPPPPQHSVPTRIVPPILLPILPPPSAPVAVPAIPARDMNKEAVGKKKKRSKQPNGLAQLLEEKRRKTAETESSGLEGFLAGI